MPKSERPAGPERLAARLAELRETNRDAALVLAIEIVGRERSHRALEPALALLAEAAPPAAWEALRARFLDLTDNGMRYDQDCALRVAIVQALRAIGVAADADLAERGLRTVQRNPPARIDVAQPLRGQCLLWLAQLDSPRADWFAVELLQDPDTAAYSGEPAVTAIRVLAEHGQTLPIWAIARRPGPSPDVLAQAFASLQRAPADLQLAALREHLRTAVDAGEAGEPVALVAAEAIVLNHLAGGYPAVFRLLDETPNLNLYLYLVLAIARGGDPDSQAGLRQRTTAESHPRKREILADAVARYLPGGRPGR
jgi:hypothetical protein